MDELPSGTVTFLLTDVEGSTVLWEEAPDAMRTALARHDALFHEIVSARGGIDIKPRGEGDSHFAVFTGSTEALGAALAIQQAHAVEVWPTPRAIRVRMGLHTGEAELRDGDYYGSPVNRCARLRGIGHGGQTLLSEASAALVRDALPEGVSLLDLGEHRLKDLARPERVFQLVSADLPAEFPPLRSLEALPNNLPRQLTTFVGRDQEMADVKRLLGATPLLTIVGVGGAGKTRLALQVAADVLDRFRDGVWLVELAPLTDPSLVAQTMATALGLREHAGLDAVSILEEHLRTRSLLIVLDNCEHLVAACAALVHRLLQTCPDLRTLATSREGLGIAGETTWRIPSLTVPDPQQLGVPSSELAAQLPHYEAVRLFIDRALAVVPHFAVTNQNAPAVAQICQQLDGIPLAVELAAARVRMLAPEQIAARLDDRLRLLTGGSRTALPRQQTLRALIDWSYDLLSDSERTVLGRLSVFSGGWTFEAAEAVCSDDGIDDFEVFDLLTQLVDKSIVVAESRGDTTRYRLLGTIRQYGAEKLSATGQTGAVRRRHRDWFAQYVEHGIEQLHGARQAVTLGLLNTEYDNIRSALDWSTAEPGEIDVAVRLADHLSWFWVLRGSLREARDWLDSLLQMTAEADQTRARALVTAGYLAHHTGDYDRAQDLLEQGVALWRQVGDPREIAIGLAQFGRLEQSLGNLDRAWSLLTESRSLFEQAGGEVVFDAPLAVFLAQVAKDRGDHENAIPLFEECLRRARAEGDLHTASSVLRSLGEMTQMRGELAEAASYFAESLRLIQELDDHPCAVIGLNALASLGAARGELVFAIHLFGAAESIRETIGYVVAPALVAQRDQALARVRTQLPSGQFDASWRAGYEMTMETAIAFALDHQASTRQVDSFRSPSF